MNTPRADRAPRADAGESLVELLVSISILGVAVVAILGAIGMSASASALHRNQSQAQNLARNWAEAVTEGARADGFWATCGPTVAAAPALPIGYSAASTIQYWNPTTKKFDGACATDLGLRQVHLAVSVPGTVGPAFAETLDVVVRKPCEASC
jgi:Tfp pilus assembly protein PilV